jgi:phospholipase/carboxylesterase
MSLMNKISSAMRLVQPSGVSQQLFLLIHPYADYALNLVPFAQTLAQHFPHASIVEVSLLQSNQGANAACLSSTPLTQARINDYVKATQTDLIDTVKYWQHTSNVTPAATALFGFSYSGTSCLELVKQPALIAGRVIAHSSPALSPENLRYPKETTIHLIHGKQDYTVPYQETIQATNWLKNSDTDFTADILPDTGHNFDAESMSIILQRLQRYIPKRLWEEAILTAPN